MQIGAPFRLILDDNRLTLADPYSLPSNLLWLSLRRCQLEHFDMRAVVGTKLRELDLGENRLVGFDGRGRCGSLRVLKLDSNYLIDQAVQALITQLPMPKLKSLDISRNRMQHPQTIPVLLSSLPALRTLTVAENAIQGEVLVDGVTPPGMRVLDLRGNQIRYLGIATILASLKTLDLTGNPTLECVDAAKHSLPRLHTARFRGTALRELQCLAQACPKVAEVDIGGCYFMMHLPRMKNVKKVFLDGCGNPQLLESLKGMPRLQSVWVDPHQAPEVRSRLG